MKHDFELLRAYVYDASESAFSALVERYLQLVYSSALRQLGGDEHRARDVAQAVFTLLAQKAGSLVDHPQIVGWLYRTTYNFAAKARRAEWRRVVREQHAYFMEEIQRGSDSVAWEEIRTVIDWGLKGLSEFDRDLVLRRYFVGQSLAEIGLTAGLTEGAARMRVDRALEKLRIRLARRGVTSTSGALTLAFSHVAYGAAPPAFVASITTAALSGAAAVPVGLTMGFGFFAIMNKATTATIALAFAAVATGVAVTQSQRARRAGATVVSLQRELAAVEAKRVSLEHDDIVERASPEAQRRVGDASVAVASVTPSPSSIHQRDVVLANPEMRPLFLKREALLTQMRFAGFFASAGLTPQQQEQFVTGYVEGIDVRWDLVGWARAAEAEAKTPEEREAYLAAFRQRLDAIQRDTSQKLKAALGEKTALLKQYQIAERSLVEQLAANVFDSKTPLSSQQARELEEILVRNKPQRSRSPVTIAGETFDGATVGEVRDQVNAQHADGIAWFRAITDAMVEEARNVLSPNQFAVLKNMQHQQRIQLELAQAAQKRAKTAGESRAP